MEGPMTLKFELALDLLTMHLPTKFHRPVFNGSEVIMLTNKPTNNQKVSAETIHLSLLCYAGERQVNGVEVVFDLTADS